MMNNLQARRSSDHIERPTSVQFDHLAKFSLARCNALRKNWQAFASGCVGITRIHADPHS